MDKLNSNPERLKILWLSHFIPYPPKGGVLQRGYHLLKQTAKYHDVDLLAFNQEDLISPLFDSLEEGLIEAESELKKLCGHVEFVQLPLDDSPIKKKWVILNSLFRPAPYTMNWLKSQQYEKALLNLLSRNNYDFIHFDTISLAPLKRLCGDIPSSLDHHNIESHMLLRRSSKESNLLKKFYFYQEGRRLEKFEKEFCPQFDFNFTCSDTDTDRLKEISPTSKTHTVPNGVDTDYFSASPDMQKTKSLIFVGTLSWYPNIEAVLFIAEKIWPKIKQAFPEFTFEIIGANPPAQIVELAKKDESFRVHGFVDDIRPLLNQAVAYVCPIKDGGGTKLKIVDALAMGMAIVADEIACEGIEVEDSKNVLFASSGNEYLEAIKDLIQNTEKREALQREARKLAEENYSYDMIGLQLSQLFLQYHKEH